MGEYTLLYRIFDAIVTDVFSYQGKDSIVYDGVLSRVLANQNRDKAFIYGFDKFPYTLDGRFTVEPECKLYLWRVKTDSADVPLDHIPPFVMRLGINYTFNKFSSDFDVNYNGWKS
ncbi:MAG: hypothetical protein IPP46_18185 [Bacteroidetes bacterium]|nr:hypothetical protein [Bacteroidota bacterium]